MEIVALGKTGLNVSRLSIGTGSNGWNGRSNQTDLGLAGPPRFAALLTRQRRDVLGFGRPVRESSACESGS